MRKKGNRFIDLTGEKFNRLTVLGLAGKNKQGRYLWLCQCICKNKVKVAGTHLQSKHTQSCGCLWKENIIKSLTIHNLVHSSEYEAWRNIKTRCLNKNNKQYKDWGGRGITICKRWKDNFSNFYKDMGERPKGLSIDRIDNNKGYYKENCRWTTVKEQMRNTRKNKMITYKGETFCMAEWAEKLKINYRTLHMRLKNNWSIERAFTK